MISFPRRKKSTATLERTDASIEAHLMDDRTQMLRRGRTQRAITAALSALLVTLGTLSGLTSATGDTHIALIGGIIAAFSVIVSTEANVLHTVWAEVSAQTLAIEHSRIAIEQRPESERQTLEALWRHEGLSPHSAQSVARVIMTEPRSWLKTTIEKQFGFSVYAPTRLGREALTIGGVTLLAALVPLIPYFFLSTSVALWVSLVLSVITLGSLGFASGIMARRSLWPSVGAFVLVGLVTGLGTAALGTWVLALLLP